MYTNVAPTKNRIPNIVSHRVDPVQIPFPISVNPCATVVLCLFPDPSRTWRPSRGTSPSSKTPPKKSAPSVCIHTHPWFTLRPFTVLAIFAWNLPSSQPIRPIRVHPFPSVVQSPSLPPILRGLGGLRVEPPKKPQKPAISNKPLPIKNPRHFNNFNPPTRKPPQFQQITARNFAPAISLYNRVKSSFHPQQRIPQ
jgi:hypothetical protein